MTGLSATITSGRPSLALFDDDWHTKICNFAPKGYSWQHEVSAPGSITFSVPLDDPNIDQLTSGRIVKAYWKGKSRMAARVAQPTTDLAVDGRIWRKWVLPGLMDVLNDGIVLPEYGIGAAAGETRLFGPMSRQDSWFVPDDWTAAGTLPYSADTRVRKGKPAGFKGLGASWIAKGDPYDGQPANAQQWFRRTFTTYSELDFEYIDAADDHRDVWIDGEQIGWKQDSSGQSFRYLGQYTATLLPGPHVIEVQVGNSRLTKPNNPVAYIAAMRQLKSDGTPVKGAPFLVTDERWLAADDVSGWHSAAAVLKLWEENSAWPIDAIHKLHPGWSDTRDSDGFGWSDYGRFAQPIGRGLLDVALEYAERAFDLDMDASTLTLHAFKRLGADRSGSVSLTLGKHGGSLKSYTATRNDPRYNSALIHLQDRTYTLREHDASIAAHGRAAMGLSMGSTAWVSTANAAADAQFEKTAVLTRSFDGVEVSTLDGPQPYGDTYGDGAFYLGDTVTGLNENGVGMPVQIMRITIDAADDRVRAYVDLIEDRDA